MKGASSAKFASWTLVLVTAAGLWVASRPSPQPEYDGKPLSYYLSSQTYGELRRERDAREAIREIGSNAVPYLVRILDQRESQFTVGLRELFLGQRLVRCNLVPLSVRQRQAAMACQELGPAAAPAIPALARLVDDPFLAPWCISALALIGPQTFPLLTNAMLNNRFEMARAEAAGDLRYMVPRERPVPALLQALKDESPLVRSSALGSLGFLGSQRDLVIPALIASLEDAEASVRASAAQSLGWFGSEAAPAIPPLLALFRREETTAVGESVMEALHSIDPRAAKSGGAP